MCPDFAGMTKKNKIGRSSKLSINNGAGTSFPVITQSFFLQYIDFYNLLVYSENQAKTVFTDSVAVQ